MGNSSSRLARIQQRARGSRAKPRDLAKPTEQHIAHPETHSQPQGGEERTGMGRGEPEKERQRGEGRVGAAGEPGNKNKCVCVLVCKSWTHSPSLQREICHDTTCARKHAHRKGADQWLHRAQAQIWKIPKVRAYVCVCVCFPQPLSQPGLTKHWSINFLRMTESL